MFPHISLIDFLKIALPVTFIYYLIVALVFFRPELRKITAGKNSQGDGDQDLSADPEPDHLEDPEAPNDPDEVFAEDEENAFSDEDYETIGMLAESLKDTVAKMPAGKFSKTELLESLSAIISSYPKYHTPIIRAALNAQIIEDSEKEGHIRLSEEELDVLWESA